MPKSRKKKSRKSRKSRTSRRRRRTIRRPSHEEVEQYTIPRTRRRRRRRRRLTKTNTKRAGILKKFGRRFRDVANKALETAKANEAAAAKANEAAAAKANEAAAAKANEATTMSTTVTDALTAVPEMVYTTALVPGTIATTVGPVLENINVENKRNRSYYESLNNKITYNTPPSSLLTYNLTPEDENTLEKLMNRGTYTKFLFIVRHAQSTINEAKDNRDDITKSYFSRAVAAARWSKQLTGDHNTPLSDKGHEQTLEFASSQWNSNSNMMVEGGESSERLGDNHIYCSPMVRTTATALGIKNGKPATTAEIERFRAAFKKKNERDRMLEKAAPNFTGWTEAEFSSVYNKMEEDVENELSHNVHLSGLLRETSPMERQTANSTTINEQIINHITLADNIPEYSIIICNSWITCMWLNENGGKDIDADKYGDVDILCSSNAGKMNNHELALIGKRSNNDKWEKVHTLWNPTILTV